MEVCKCKENESIGGTIYRLLNNFVRALLKSLFANFMLVYSGVSIYGFFFLTRVTYIVSLYV